jgi:methylmalonyl-CoA/ethylmalonyl-CoA epimerase
MIGRLNHVAIAVPNLAVAAAKYRDLLGATHVGAPQALPEHGVTVVFVTLENSKVELMMPLGENSQIAGFLAKHPSGGMHHICFEVPNVEAAAQALVEGGARVLGDGKAKVGAHGLPVIFLHPKDFDGTLIELEEVKPELMPA